MKFMSGAIHMVHPECLVVFVFHMIGKGIIHSMDIITIIIRTIGGRGMHRCCYSCKAFPSLESSNFGGGSRSCSERRMNKER